MKPLFSGILLLTITLLALTFGVPGVSTAATRPAIYVTNTGSNTISRAKLDGSGGVSLGNMGNSLANTLGIALDAANNKMYVTSWGPDVGSVVLGDLDGVFSSSLILANNSFFGPAGIALDLVNRKMYVANLMNSTVAQAYLDVYGGVSLGNLSGWLNYPWGIALDVANNKMYIANQGAGNSTVVQANLDGTGGVSLGNLGGTLTDAEGGIALDLVNRKMYVTNFGNSTVVRANLDGTGGENLGNLGGTLNGPAGIALELVNRKMYVVNFNDSTVVRANLDGTGGENLGNLGGTLNGPQDIALDLGDPATVITQTVTSIAVTTATGNGNITTLGMPSPTSYGVCWNTTGMPTTADSKTDLGTASATGAFMAGMTGLNPNTTYYVRAYATNTAGTSYGEEVSFATVAPVVYVKPGGLISGLCDNWNSACELRYGLTNAVSGQELWIQTGTYVPNATGDTDRTKTFQLKSGVALYGGFAGTESDRSQRGSAANVTTLSGDIGTHGDSIDNSYHVVTGSGTDSTAILYGFIITGGNANDGSASDGGGIYINAGNPTITNVTLNGNFAINYGGGMYISSGSPLIMNVTFSGNSADNSGGMYINAGSPTITNVTFSGNTAAATGGAMFISSGSPTITNVTFNGNSAAAGGGIFIGGGSPTITNSIFWGDSASAGPEIYMLGSLTITNSVIRGGCPGGATCSDMISTDPFLGPLADNGGPTQTIALLAGSPAINAGTNSGCPVTDQRSMIRTQCDIGAYEFIPVLLTITKSGAGAGDVTVTPGLLSPWDNDGVAIATCDSGTNVKVTASASSCSILGSWGDVCIGHNTPICTVTMNGAQVVTISFDLTGKAWNVMSGRRDDVLQAAFDSINEATAVQELRMQTQSSNEAITMNKTVMLDLKGGYDCDFSDSTPRGMSGIAKLTITDGALIIGNIEITGQ